MLLGAAYAATLYVRQRNFKDPSLTLQRILYALAVLRFVTVTIIALLLLSPFIETIKEETEQPSIIFAQDNSESVQLSFEDEQDSLDYVNRMQAIREDLREDYNVISYTFGEELKENEEARFTEKATNISNSLNELQELYANQNVGAIVLASDGIYNQGFNPRYSEIELKAPIYTVALGDTSVRRDFRLEKTYYNRIAYLDDKFPVKVDYKAAHLKGEKTDIKIYEVRANQGNEEVASQSITIEEDSEFGSARFILEADETGMQHYRIVGLPFEDEVTEVNNSKDIFIDVLDSRKKVLIAGNSPHPDIGAIRTSIVNNKNYEANIHYPAQEEPVEDIEDYQMAILHQLPSSGNRANELLNKLQAEDIPVLFIIGEQTSIPAFNELQSFLEINNNRGRTNEAQGKVNTGFTLFTVSKDLVSSLESYPPLKVPFGDYKTAPGTDVLLKQKIGNVDAGYPLALFNELGGTKTGVIAGEGIWRWQLYNYFQQQNHEIFDEIVSKTVQYLSVKADKRRFKVMPDKNVYAENEPITMEAELYNESYELVNEPEVTITITDEEGKEYPFTFNRTSNAYTLDAGFLPVGDYSFTASTSYNNEKFTYSGDFSVKPLQLELLQTKANHQLLYTLARKYGGDLVPSDSVGV
ncbi:MAG: hypothetical protein BRD50_00065, partial [Bacteroidetes bacterium SW_11_45_7]